MKLDKIETFVCANPPPRHGGRYFIFVRLTKDCGISGVGEIYNAIFSPTLCASMAANIQIATASSNFLILESIDEFQDAYTSMVELDWGFEAGRVIPPTTAGLGIRLKDDVIAPLPYVDNALHLEMETVAVSGV